MGGAPDLGALGGPGRPWAVGNSQAPQHCELPQTRSGSLWHPANLEDPSRPGQVSGLSGDSTASNRDLDGYRQADADS